MSLPFEGGPANRHTYAALLAQAAKFDEKLPRCAQCGGFLGEERWGPYYKEEDYCSEYCAEKHYAPEPETEEEAA